MLFVPTSTESRRALERHFLEPEYPSLEAYWAALAERGAAVPRAPRTARTQYLGAFSGGLVVGGFGKVGVNLTAFLDRRRGGQGVRFNHARLAEVAALGLRLADALWGLNRVAFGFDGLADVCLLRGLDYGGSRARTFVRQVLASLQCALLEESVRLAAANPSSARPRSPLLHDPRRRAAFPAGLWADARRYGVRHDALIGVRHDVLAALAFCNGAMPGILPLAAAPSRVSAEGQDYRFDAYGHAAALLHRRATTADLGNRAGFERLSRVVRPFADGGIEAPDASLLQALPMPLTDRFGLRRQRQQSSRRADAQAR